MLVLSAAVLSEAINAIELRRADEPTTVACRRMMGDQGQRSIREPSMFDYDYEHRCAEHEHEQAFGFRDTEIQPLNDSMKPQVEGVVGMYFPSALLLRGRPIVKVAP